MNNRTEYLREYHKENTLRLSLNLSKSKDKDIIQAIESEIQGNKQASIKSLIRRGIGAAK
mgnify:CR=1 FL=1